MHFLVNSGQAGERMLFSNSERDYTNLTEMTCLVKPESGLLQAVLLKSLVIALTVMSGFGINSGVKSFEGASIPGPWY